MRMANFINLSVVCGFFIGLVAGLLRYNEPEMILFVMLVVTIVMYLISLVMAAVYVFMIKPQHSMFINKQAIEKRFEEFDTELDRAEQEVRSIGRFIKNLNLSNELQEERQKA